ncbi:hypothetical protein OROGR_000811 [Orobanche gracilis]
MKKRVARILFFKIRSSQEILKIRDGTPLEAEEILTYIKNPRNGSIYHFSTKFDVPSNVVQNKRVARILFFKIRSSQEILKICDYNVLQKNRVTRILVFKSKPSQEILKIRDGTPWEAEEILTYIKKPSKQIDCHFSTKFDLPSNVVQDKRVARIVFFKIRSSQEILKIRDGTPLEKKRVARILFFKIRSSQEILKIRDGTPLEAEEILTYIKNPRNGSIYHFSTKFDVPTNIVQNKRVARILFFKIRSSQEILKICDGTPLEKNRVTRILVFKSKPSQEILKIRDGTPWEAEEILTYIKKPSKQIDCHFSTKFDLPSNVVQDKRVARILFFKIRSSQEILKIRDGAPLEKKRVARILFFKIRSSQEILKIRDGTPLEKNRVTRILVFKSKPSQEILKIRDGTPWEAEEILTYIKKPSKQINCHFSTKFDLPSNVVQDKRVARILFFKIRSSQEILKIRDGAPLEKKRVARILFFKIRSSQKILKIRDGTPLEAEEILTYIKNPRNGSIYHFSTKFDVPSNVVQNKRVARILFFKIRSSQEILKICDCTPLEKKRVARILFFKIRSSQEILKIRDGTPLEKNRVTRILVFKSKPSQEILKIRDGTPWEAEEILTYIKKPSKHINCHFSTKFDLPSNVVQDKRVARILFFKIRSSQEILKIRDGAPLEKKRVARILFFKIRSSQEILKIRDGTPLEAEEILTYIKNPRNGSIYHFSTKFNVPTNIVQNKRVARILFFKIRSSQEILKICDGTPLEKKRVARILFFKIRSSQEILKIRDCTPLEAEEILTYIKNPRNGSIYHFSTKFDVPTNIVQNKRVARILFFKIRSSQEIIKICDGTPLEKKRVARILFFKIRSSQEILKIRDGTPLEKNRVTRILVFKSKPSQEILKIRDGTPWEAEEILTYIKKPSKQIDCHFSTKFDLPSNVVQNKRVARILFFKISSSQEFLENCDGTPLEKNRVTRILVFKSKPSQEILKIRDGTPWEAEEILTYIKKPSKQIDCHFSTKFDLPSNVVQDKRVARILFFKIRSSQEILKIRDGTPLEKKRVARILFFKIRSSQEILKIRDGTPLEAEEILTYIKNPRNGSIYHFSTKFDVPTNIVQNKRVARILFFKIRSSQEILKICDCTPLEKKRVARILFFKIRSSQEILKIRDGTPLEKNRVTRILVFKSKPSQEILKIRDGTPWEAEEILTYIKKPSKQINCHFSTKFDLPSNVVQDKRVARILFFKIRSSQEILKIRDGAPLEKKRVARILFFKIRSSQEILKIRDGTPLEAEEILTYIKNPRNGSIYHFSTKFDVPTNIVQNKRVARILFFKIRSSQEILKICDGTPLEKNKVTRILVFKSKPSQEILKIRDGTPWEAEEILTYIKKPSKQIDCHFSTKFDLPSNVVQDKRVARILFFKIRSSQEILKIRDGTPLEKKRVAQILFFKIRSSQEILKIRDGTPLEAEEILTYIKNPRNGSIYHFSTKFDVPTNIVQNKRVARILFFKIRSSQEILKICDGTPLEKNRVTRILVFKSKPSQEILKIRDGTPWEAEEILTYIKKPSKQIDCHFSTKFDLPSNVVQDKRVARILFFKIRSSQEILKIRDGTPLEKKRVARILFFKIRSSQEILKIRDGTPLEAEEILTYIKNPRNGSIYHFSTKFDVPTNIVQNKRVARILFFKIRSSQEIIKICDGTPLEKKRVARILFFKIRSSQEILKIRDGTPLEKNRVTRILVFKSKPSQEILKIRDGTPWEAEEILTYIKKPSKQIDCHFSTKFDLPSNVVQNKRVARILFFKISSSQEFLENCDGTPLEKKRVARILFFKIRSSQEILKIRDDNVLQKNRVTRILVFKSKPSQEILKIRDGTPWEAEEILTYIKKPSKQIDCHFSTKFDLPSNVVQDKRVARILFFKIRSSQEILKIRDGTPLEKKRVARILFFKIRPSQEILKIRDGTPLEAEEILTYIKNPRNGSIYHFSTKFDVPTNIVQNKRVARILFFKIRTSQEIIKICDGTPLEKKRVARILFFKIRSSQEILKIRDGTPLEAEEILTYIKKPSKRIDLSLLYQKNRVTRILVFKSKPFQEILKIRDGTPWEAEEILTYIKKPSKQIDCHFSTKFDLPSNVVQNKRVARILFFKIRSSQEFLKIRDGTPLEKKRVARILFFKIRSSQEILKIRDGTALEFDLPSNVLQKNRVTRILVFKSKPSQEILKIRDGTPWEAEEILTYIKKPLKQIDYHFSTKFDLPSNVVQNKRVARILFFKIRSSQEFLKIRDGTPLEAEEILTYIKKNRVTRILVFKSKPSQEILKIRDGTPWEAEEILTYIKKPSKQIDCHFSTKFDLPSNVVQDKRVARILFFKIRSSQEILKIRDGTPLEKNRVTRILVFKSKPSQEILKIRDGTPWEKILKIRDGTPWEKNRVTRILVFKSKPSQEILKIRDGTPWEAEEILTYIKKPSKQIDCHFSTKFDLPSNVVQDKRVARILFFKIRSSQEILKIRDGTPLEKNRVTRILVFKSKPSQEILKIRDGTPWEAEEILTYIKNPRNRSIKKRVAQILFFKIRSSQEILKIRDGTPWEAEEISTYIKKPSKQTVWHFYSKFDVPSNVVQNKRVARILFFKIRSSQEILKICDGTPLEKNRVTRILVFKSKPSQEILKIRDGTPWEAEEILTYIKKPSKQIDCHFSTKFDLPSNVVQDKRVARILFFKIRSSQEILKIRDGTPLEKNRVTRILVFKSKPSQEILKIRDGTPWEKNRVTRILVFKSKPSQEILKIRDGTPWEAEEILTYIKKPSKQIDCHLSTKFDLPSNVVQNKRVARILFFKIRSSQEFLKIRDGTPLEKKRVARILFFKIRSSQEILKIRDGTPLEKNRVTRILVFKSKPSQEILKIRDGTPWEAEEILTYIKKPSKQNDCHFSTKFDLPSNVVQDKRVARILFFKIRSSQEILKIRDGTPLEKNRVTRILKKRKNRVTRILVFKSKPSQEILKIRDGTLWEAEEILTYIKKPSKQIDCHLSTKFDLPSNVVQNKRVARILFFKIRSSQEFLKIRDGTPLEKKRVARILFFKIRSSQEILKIRDGTPLEKNRVTRILVFKSKPSQEILKIRDGTPWEAEEILTYIKKPSKQNDCHFSTKFDLPSNVVQDKRVARILFFKIRSSQEILKIRDGTPLEKNRVTRILKKRKNRVTRILVFKSKPSQEILKIRDGTPWEAEEILTYIKKPSKQIDCHFSTKFDLPSNVVQNKRVARILFFKIRSSQEFLKIRDGTPLEKKRVARILFFKIRSSQEILKIRDGTPLEKNRVTRILVFKSKPSQEILKIRDGTPWEAEEILTYIKKPSKQNDCHFSTKFDLPSNVVQDKRVARILFFKIRSSQEILKIRDGTPLEKNRKRKNRVTRILVFKSKPSQEILKIRDGTPWEAEEILTYIKKPSKQIDCHFSTKFDLPSNVVQNKRVARILFFKIRSSQEFLKIRDGTPLEKNRVTRILVFKSKPSQEILKIRDGTPWEAEEILTYIKKPSKQIDCHFSTKFDLPSNVVQNKRVARILFFKIRSSQEFLKIRDGTPLENRVTRILVFKSKPSQEILKIRDGTPWEAEEILTYIKKPSKQIDCHFSTKFDLPSNVVQDKIVARILFFKIRSSQEILKICDGTPLEKNRVTRILVFKSKPSQEILKIRDGTPWEAEEILTYIKKPSKQIDCHFSTKFDLPSNVVQNKRVARILFFKIRSSQEFLKIRDGTPLEKNRVTRILVFKSKPSQEILKIRDGTPWEAEEILTYIKKPSKQIDCHFSTKFDLPSNVVQNKRVARILFFKIRSSQEFLKIRDGTPLEKKRVARILFFKIRSSQEIIKIRDDTPLEKNRVTRILVFKSKPSQEILKIRDGTPWEAEEILTYIKKPSKQIDCHFSTKLDLPSNVVQNKRVARILFFKIRSSQEFLKIRDGTPLEKNRVTRILVFKSKPSQEILKIRDGTPWEAEEILTYIKKPSKQIDCHFSTKLDLPSNVVQNKRVARILFFKIRSSQEFLKIRDGTPLEAEEILTYIKKPSKQIDCHFSTKFDLPSNVVQDKIVARILFFKIRSSQEILKICDGTPLEKNRVTRILVFKSKPSQEILKIRDGTPWEAEEILTYIKKPSKQIDCHFSTKFDLPSNVVQNKRVARILFFKIRSSQEFLKIRDGTPLEKNRVTRILVFKSKPSQEILKIRDGTPWEAEEILTYIKKPSKQIDCHFSTKFDLPSNVVQNKRVARILFFKIRSSQEFLKIRDGTPLEAEEILTYIKSSQEILKIHNVLQKNRVTRILVFKSKPSQEILKIRDGTPWEAEEILTYIKKPSKQIDCHFSTKFDLPSNVVQDKRVARILFFKIRSSQEILKICDGTPSEPSQEILKIRDVKNRVTRILVFKSKPSQEILKIRDGTPWEAEEILTYIKKPSKQIDCHFSTKFDLPSNVVQDKRVARILFFKIRSSQEILKIRDGTPLEAEEILTYIKTLETDRFITSLPSSISLLIYNVLQKKRVARILFFKIRSSQEILKVRDGTPLEAEEILTYIKNPRNGSIYHFSTKFDVPTNIVQNKRVARILFFKIRSSQEILKICDGTPLEICDGTPLEKNRVTRILVFKSKPSQEILKIRDGTPWEAEEILTYIKKPSKQIDCHFSTKLDLPSNVVQNKRVARILFFKIRSSQEFLKIRDGTPLEAEEILTYIKKPSKWIDLKNRVTRILVFKSKPSQEILKIRDGTPWEAEEILTYIKKPSKQIDCHFSTKFDLPSNVVQDKRVARILFFKIRSSQEILKIRDGTPLEAEEILTYIKTLETDRFITSLPMMFDLTSNVLQKKRVARILFFKIRSSQEILKVRDGTPLEAEEILTYIKNPRNGSIYHFSTKFDVPTNIVQNKRVARILFFKIRSSQEILKICDGTPLEKKRVARILFFKIRSSQEILKVCDGTPLEFDLPSNVLQKNRVTRILVFKSKPSQEILKIRDGTPWEAEEILTYIKKPSKQIDCHFSTKLDLPSNVVQNKRVARILFFKIRSSQEFLKIRDGTPLEANVLQKNRVTRILVFKSKPSQEILKIRDGTPWEAEEILTYIKKPSKQIDCHFSTKFDLPSNVVQDKRVARILFFKIRSSQEILKIRDGTPLEAEEILTYIKSIETDRFITFLASSMSSQEILKVRDGTPLEAEEILTYIKNPRNGSIYHFSTKFDVPTNIVQNKRVARILFFKIRSSQEILKICDGTPLEKKRVARILFFKIRSSQEILKVRDGTPLEFDLPSNVLQKNRVTRILVFKSKPSQEILKIRDGTPWKAEEILTYIKKPSKQIDCHFSTKLDLPSNVVQNKRVARILFFKIRSSQEFLKIRDGTPLEAEEILTYIKKPSKWIDFNVLQKNRVTRILVFKSKPSQEILKIRDGTPWEAEEILTYIKKPSKQIDCHFSTKLDLPSNVVQNKRVARILVFKIRSSQEFLKIRDSTPLEAEEILTYIKKPSKWIDLSLF